MKMAPLLVSLVCFALPVNAQVQPPAYPAPPVYGMPIQPAATVAPIFLVTTTMTVDGYRIREYKGIVRGSMVRQPTVGQSFKGSFQGMFGGKVGAFIEMCEQGRQQAYDTMVQRAQQMGANAVIGMSYDSNSFSVDRDDFATEVVCYGTAVVIEPMR
jgi:uncharacterized protein YbjQ (UPF0145 family)